ncbi:MAG TPA: glycosyltransferase family 2 protein [Actinomycetota bacterium]|nr:glycosyltransferase family 2 protein [Actinomycetota bacterium]
MSDPRVVAVVAAHNEEATVGQTVKELLAIHGVGEVVVAVDGSTDRTAQEARSAGARVFEAGARRGKGAALEAALRQGPTADWYLFMDGDVGATASEAARLLEKVRSGGADLAIGRLPALSGGGFGLVRRLAGGLIRLLSGPETSAPLSGQRAITNEALQACRPLAAGFGVETAMTIDAVRLGFRVVEVDVAMTHRATGRGISGFLHRGGQGMDILRAVLPRALRLR